MSKNSNISSIFEAKTFFFGNPELTVLPAPSWDEQGSISSTFYTKLLGVQIPKVQKDTGNLTEL